MSKVQEVVGANMRSLRVAAGVTQEELSEAMRTVGFSFHRATVAEVEAGRRPLTVEELPLVAAYFEMPVRALLISPGSNLPMSEVEVGGNTVPLRAWSARVLSTHGEGWKVLEGPAPKATQSAYDEMLAGVDRPWARRWRREGGSAADAYAWARDRALAARKKLPGPAYVAEEHVGISTVIGPWGQTINLELEPGQIYVARDEAERDALAEAAAVRKAKLRRITPQEAYRRRKRQ